MGRGKVELKRIENNINRQVTFSKRRGGLLKKAHEISVLCDAEVALIVFSNNGKLFEYSTDSCMEKILERYERYSYAERRLVGNNNASELQENWSLEYTILKSKIELLQRSQRHFVGEDLDALSSRELQSLEQQLDTALKHIRLRKNQLMHQSISELQKKERAIQEHNNMLTKKIKEKEKAIEQDAEWEQHINNRASTSNFILPQQLPCLNMSNPYQDQGETLQPGSGIRRNELELTLESDYSYHLGCFAS